MPISIETINSLEAGFQKIGYNLITHPSYGFQKVERTSNGGVISTTVGLDKSKSETDETICFDFDTWCYVAGEMPKTEAERVELLDALYDYGECALYTRRLALYQGDIEDLLNNYASGNVDPQQQQYFDEDAGSTFKIAQLKGKDVYIKNIVVSISGGLNTLFDKVGQLEGQYTDPKRKWVGEIEAVL